MSSEGTHRGPGAAATVKRRRGAIVDAMRARLWPVPLAGVLVAILAGIFLPALDSRLNGHLPESVTEHLFGGGADAAREVLGTIATSLITVTSLTFSLTLVTMQLASSQYSPRLLRSFSSDRFVQRTLTLFLATFAYSLTVLRRVRSGRLDGVEFVPQISVTVAYVLAMGSVLGLVVFLGHLVRQIRIETMLDQVASESIGSAHHLLERAETADQPVDPLAMPPQRTGIEACSSGYLVEVDEEVLLAAAVEADAVLSIRCRVGDPVVARTVVAYCWPAEAVALSSEAIDQLGDKVSRALNCGAERTAAQDIGYGLRQLTDVVIRALSPGINDPSTAIHAINSATVVLCELTRYRLGPETRYDSDGTARLHVARPDFPELLDLVCAQPRRYGAHDPAVLGSLLSMLKALSSVTRSPVDRQAIGDQLARIEQICRRQDFDTVERDHLSLLTQAVEQSLQES
ncbi:hypothetical protein BOX37_08100 [Nocardia mangyaensis]|uniref:DUF2254 domain-containing protein n=1 Tax=Nocardia mangyaensis TaxID=2213200 RepID=A0A1J0VPI7_9NOCA|nr:DUF2254 domain-containing protein [Nocardia mangyaensis]APE33934.1 hypothetical protein BOX37_08100 [Nocardia mangyaensis]